MYIMSVNQFFKLLHPNHKLWFENKYKLWSESTSDDKTNVHRFMGWLHFGAKLTESEKLFYLSAGKQIITDMRLLNSKPTRKGTIVVNGGIVPIEYTSSYESESESESESI